MDTYNLISTLKRDFMRHCMDIGGSNSLVEMYEKNLTAFVDYLADNSLRYYEDLHTTHIQHYFNFLEEQNNPKKNLECFRSIRVFCSWVRKESKKTLHDPARETHLPRSVSHRHITISKKALKEIALSCGNDTIGLRDCAIILLLSDVGMKSVELCQLRRKDYSSSTLIVQPSHSYVGRTITLIETTAQTIERYLYANKHQDNQIWLFTTVNGKRITHSTLRDILRRRCIDCGYYDFIRPRELWEAHIHDEFSTSKLPNCLKCQKGFSTDNAVVYRPVTVEDLYEAFNKYGPRIEDP